MSFFSRIINQGKLVLKKVQILDIEYGWGYEYIQGRPRKLTENELKAYTQLDAFSVYNGDIRYLPKSNKGIHAIFENGIDTGIRFMHDDQHYRGLCYGGEYIAVNIVTNKGMVTNYPAMMFSSNKAYISHILEEERWEDIKDDDRYTLREPEESNRWQQNEDMTHSEFVKWTESINH